jgi:hypothetical protein
VIGRCQPKKSYHPFFDPFVVLACGETEKLIDQSINFRISSQNGLIGQSAPHQEEESPDARSLQE